MNALTKQNPARQGGMTLIELAVVLLVLVGLAGLTLPYVSGFLGKTSTATGAASNADAYNALALYQATTGSYPNNLDLLSAGGKVDPMLDDKVLSTGGTSPMNWTMLSTGISNVATSLSAAGISTVVPSPHVDTNFPGYTQNGDGTYTVTTGVSATFDPAFMSSTPVAVASAGGFVTSNDGMFTDICGPSTTPSCSMMGSKNGQTIANLLGYSLPTGHAIIVLGINSRNSAVGQTLASAPVVFPASATANPSLVYARYMAAFDVDAAKGTSPAKLIGVVYGSSSMMLESVGSSIANYYNGLTAEKM